MKKLLTVLSLVIFSATTIEAATFYAHAAAKVATEAQGMGVVCVTTTNTTPTSDWKYLSALVANQTGNANNATINFYYHAKANDGYYFAGWSTTDGGSEMGTATPSFSVSSSSQDPYAPNTQAPTYYAMFKPYLNVIQHDKMIRYVNQDGDENINNSVIIVEAKETNISFTLSGTNKGLFALVNPQTAQKAASLTVPTKQGLAQVELQYLGNFNDAIGKTVNIVVTAGSRTTTLKTTIEDMPTLTFLPTKSNYTVTHTNGTGVTYTVNQTSPTITRISEEGMLTVELALANTTNGTYAFVGWQEITQDANGNEIVKYISYDKNCVYTFKGSAQVRPEFINDVVATFYIQSQKDKKIAYHDFALVMHDAEELYKLTGEAQVVVFESMNAIRGFGTTRVDGTLDAGNYTIPKGVTLLIPGDDARTCRIGDAILADYGDRASSNPYTLKRKLSISDATTITVYGNLSVYAKMTWSMPYNGRPLSYGQIEMGTNSNIIAEDGAILTIYGYITGNVDNSSVTIKSGARIHESFQIKDFRGGWGTASVVTNVTKNMFFVQQYYIQSVEVQLIVQSGGYERLATAVEMSNEQVCANATFIAPESEDALFTLGNNAEVVKYYNEDEDRINLCLRSQSAEHASANLKSISMNIASYDVNSSEYVMPLTNNMDLSIYNTNLTVHYAMALLAGATLYVDPKSEVHAESADLFVYDNEESYVYVKKVSLNLGFWEDVYLKAGNYNYFGSGNTYCTPLDKRPAGIKYDRKANDFEKTGTKNGSGAADLYRAKSNAKCTVDGLITGKLYTTNGGASIISNGGGRIINTATRTSTLKQGVQYTVSGANMVTYGDIKHTLAKLQHADGTYLTTVANTTYYYDKNTGTWGTTQTTPAVDDNDYTPTFTLSAPSVLNTHVEQETTSVTSITKNNANVTWENVDWSYQITGLSANQFTAEFDATSNPTNATVTFKPTSAGSSKTATLKIIASYVANQKLYTCEKTIELTGNALANANDLDFTLSAISTADGAKTLFTGGNDGAITITNSAALTSYVTLTPDGNNYKIQAKDGVNTTITVEAKQDENGNVAAANISKIITIGSGKQPLPVTIRLDASNFNQVTWAKSSGVTFNNGLVMSPHSQWTAFFTGTPDKLKFTPTTATTWQVEEFDGKGWNVLYAWATIPANKEFALSLSPTASKVRIRSAKTGGTLSNVVITALSESYVKANVDALYIPMVTGSDTYTTSVLVTYMAEDLVTLSTSNSALLALDKTVLDPAVDNYKQEVVTLTSHATEPGEYRMSIRVGSEERIVIPIIVYEVPQMLPIMLKSDADDNRYYYVTPASQHAAWNASERTVTLKNEVGTCAPSLTFAFGGAPSYISFTPTAYKGTWHVEQSADAQTWFDASVATEKHSENTHEFAINQYSQYVRVTYESYYAEEIILSNLMIVGEPSVIVEPLEMEITKGTPEQLTITAVNLSAAPTYTFSDPSIFGIEDVSTTGTIAANSVATIIKNISYTGNAAIAYGTLTITYASGKSVVVNLVGLSRDLNTATGIMTGVNPEQYTIEGKFEPYTYHEVNIANAYANNQTLFDYLVVYGETKPATGTKITLPTASAGSNAITPCFIYKAKTDKSGYELVKYEENTNTAFKVLLGDEDVIHVPKDKQLDIYMTGFCPYASTGYTKAFEGVWYFQGKAGASVNVYLEDCHIYSRNKTEDGHPFQSKQDGNSFSESYVRGSGGVLVFECDEMSNKTNPFKANIHTRGNNVLKSNHGCFFDILGYRAYQVSSPIQIHMKDDKYVNGSTTELTFDDLWPNTTQHTNGYLALKKQVNNAPSIDMGNTNTVVNFRGGRVHLENAQIVSVNYQTSLAICYRSGKMGGIDFHFAHGIGTDDVGGTVNFYDGTTTVESMTVDAKYRQYYLMDTDASGNELTTTSCLRTPKNTYVYGGSHCMMRACSNPTSKGGAPSDGTNPLGKFEYTLTTNDVVDADSKLADIKDFPNECLADYYKTASGYENQTYGLSSVTPKDGKLSLWLPDVCGDYKVKPEVDMDTRFWAACMTKISAEAGGQGGEVGGPTTIEDNTEVQNLLYCKMDEYIYDAITTDGYQAPVQVPSTDTYQRIPISVEGYEEGQEIDKVLQNYVTNENDYVIKDRVYYVTTATADMWMAFTPPFDVENVYVIESYSEKELQKVKSTDNQKTKRQAVMEEQAKHNADFAAFYGVSMALYSKSPIDFWGICDNFIDWAKQEDKNNLDSKGNPLYSSGNYNLRGKYELKHYDGSNAATSNYYLYENAGNWTLSGDDDGVFDTQWQYPDESDGVLMNKGVTYSMLFPYCTGCGMGDNIKNREFWDYWSGKYIIFESIPGANIKDAEGNSVGHTIKGSNYVAAEDPDAGKSGDWVLEGLDDSGTDAIVTGNSTFSKMITNESELYTYYANEISMETFYRNVDWDDDGNDLEKEEVILPTSSFLLATLPATQPVQSVTRDGKIMYRNGGNGNSGNGTTTGGNLPTVGGGNELFITAIATGINIAVSVPQHVRVITATGVVLFNGMIQTATDVALPVDGIYIVSGENEVHKIQR